MQLSALAQATLDAHARAAADAVAAERERCAKIAEVIGAEFKTKNKFSAGIEFAGTAIAAAIRKSE